MQLGYKAKCGWHIGRDLHIEIWPTPKSICGMQLVAKQVSERHPHPTIKTRIQSPHSKGQATIGLFPNMNHFTNSTTIYKNTPSNLWWLLCLANRSIILSLSSCCISLALVTSPMSRFLQAISLGCHWPGRRSWSGLRSILDLPSH